MAECGVREKGSEREKGKGEHTSALRTKRQLAWQKAVKKSLVRGGRGTRRRYKGEGREEGEGERGRTSAALNAAPNWTRNSPMELHRNISNYFGAAKEQRVPGNPSW